jgi:DNA-directed RNA polymerase subunit RPC12/RpoP
MEWKAGDTCPNCGGPMPLVPRPPADVVRAHLDRATSAPIPQRYDTAPERDIDELGDLYRCDRCDSKVRVKPTTPTGAGTGA